MITKHRLIGILAALIAVLPFLGFPYFYERLLISISALGVLCVLFFVVREIRLNRSHGFYRHTHSEIVESGPGFEDTTIEDVYETEEPETVAMPQYATNTQYTQDYSTPIVQETVYAYAAPMQAAAETQQQAVAENYMSDVMVAEPEAPIQKPARSYTRKPRTKKTAMAPEPVAEVVPESAPTSIVIEDESYLGFDEPDTVNTNERL